MRFHRLQNVQIALDYLKRRQVGRFPRMVIMYVIKQIHVEAYRGKQKLNLRIKTVKLVFRWVNIFKCSYVKEAKGSCKLRGTVSGYISICVRTTDFPPAWTGVHLCKEVKDIFTAIECQEFLWAALNNKAILLLKNCT